MESQWYYTVQGQQQGPVPEGQLRALVQTGQVAQNEFVFRDGMPDWAVVSACPELLGTPAAGGPPPVPMSPPATAAGAFQSPAASGITVGTVLQEAAAIFKEQWKPLLIGAAIVFGIAIVGGFMLGIVEVILKDRNGILSRLFGMVINGPMTLGLWIMALNAVDRRAVRPQDVLEGFNQFIPAFVLNLLMTIAVFAGLLALIVGAIAVAALVVLSWGYLADKKCGPIDALTQSFNCAKANFVLLLVLTLLAGVMMVGGMICLILGMIPAMAFASVMLAVAYRWLNPQVPDTAVQPAA